MDFVIDKIGLNSFQLKMIAMITMMVDHTGAIFFPGEMLFRYIGRISFPIFCFLLVEGFYHTKDIRRYLFRLLVFAFLSEIPYDLAFYQTFLSIEKQNIFFTLAIGVGIIYVLEQEGEWILKILEILFAMWLAEFLHTDYGFKGILLICVFYFLRESYYIKLSAGIAWNFLWGNSIQYFGALAMVPAALYNGRRGPAVKYLFYVFYPAHLLALALLKKL